MTTSILDILYRLNCELCRSSKDRFRFKSICRKFIQIGVNIIIPIYYKVFQFKDIGHRTLPIVVSLTSFPARINRVWITIESMIRQTQRAEKIVIWLSREQFPDEKDSLPKNLLQLCDSGLDIRFVDGDIRSFKKFYYAFQEFPNKCVVTIDDDLLFPSTFVEHIYDCSVRHPNSVIANFGFKFRWDETINYIEVIDSPITEEETGRHLFFGSGGGTLFRPEKMLPFMDNIFEIRQICPTADDIYLNSLSRLADLDVTFMSNSPLLSLWNRSDVKLDHYNGPMSDINSKNAEQLRKLVEYTKLKHKINPFS